MVLLPERGRFAGDYLPVKYWCKIFFDLPHPSPLPKGEGVGLCVFWLADDCPANPAAGIFKKAGSVSPSPWGEGRDEGGRLTNCKWLRELNLSRRNSSERRRNRANGRRRPKTGVATGRKAVAGRPKGVATRQLAVASGRKVVADGKLASQVELQLSQIELRCWSKPKPNQAPPGRQDVKCPLARRIFGD